jgi:Glycosyl hydrolases family 2
MFALEIVVTYFDPAEAEIVLTHAPEDLTASAAGLELRGTLTGPRNVYAETAGAVHTLERLARREDVTRSRVHIPKPAFWSPEAPCVYEGTVDLWRDGVRVDQQDVAYGIKDLVLDRKGLRLNGEPLTLLGFPVKGALTPDTAERLRAAGGNLLLVPLCAETLPVWSAADRLGFFVLGEVDPADDALLWKAHDDLCQHISCLGWLLPQAATRQPQHWHNAMTLLHGRRRDVFVGVRVDELPLGALPGHVDFLAAGADLLEELASLQVPKLALTRRPDRFDSRAVLGLVSRVLPEG